MALGGRGAGGRDAVQDAQASRRGRAQPPAWQPRPRVVYAKPGEVDASLEEYKREYEQLALEPVEVRKAWVARQLELLRHEQLRFYRTARRSAPVWDGPGYDRFCDEVGRARPEPAMSQQATAPDGRRIAASSASYAGVVASRGPQEAGRLPPAPHDLLDARAPLDTVFAAGVANGSGRGVGSRGGAGSAGLAGGHGPLEQGRPGPPDEPMRLQVRRLGARLWSEASTAGAVGVSM